MLDNMFHEKHGDNDLFTIAAEENPELFSTANTSKSIKDLIIKRDELVQLLQKIDAKIYRERKMCNHDYQKIKGSDCEFICSICGNICRR